MKLLNDRGRSPYFLFLSICLNLLMLVGCAPAAMTSEMTAPKVTQVSVEFLDEYRIPKDEFQGTAIGGLSAIYYEPKQDLYYALSDDRSNFAPARFYTLQIDLDESGVIPQINQLQIASVTTLKDEAGELFPSSSLDPEGLVFSPRQTLFISSEGDRQKEIAPFVKEFDLNGQEVNQLRIPERFLFNSPTQGIQNNFGFEALAIAAPSLAPEDPFRIFVAPEYSLIQDAADRNISKPIRLLHYVVNPIGDPVLIAEHLYPLEPTAEGVLVNGLVELIALPEVGSFLSLERTFGIAGSGAKLFQITIGNATDTFAIESLAGNPDTVIPIQKTLLLDLKSLGIALDNLEGMTLGRKFADGSQSLLLISDDNFSQNQVNQVLLFRLSNSAANATSK